MYLSKLWCNYLWCHTSIFDWIPLFLLWCFHHYFDSVIPALMLLPALMLISQLLFSYLCSVASISALPHPYQHCYFYITLRASMPVFMLLSVLKCYNPYFEASIPAKRLSLLLWFLSLFWHFFQWYDASIPIVKSFPPTVKFLSLLSSFYT